MRVALTASGNNLDAPLGNRFGRAPKFLVYDTEVGTVDITDNERNLNTPKGAGIRLAVKRVEANVDAVIYKHIGSIAYEPLTAAQMRGLTLVKESDGPASQAIKEIWEKL